jgi:hypothetical protein
LNLGTIAIQADHFLAKKKPRTSGGTKTNPNSSSRSAQNRDLDAPITVDRDAGPLLWQRTNFGTFAHLVLRSNGIAAKSSLGEIIID